MPKDGEASPEKVVRKPSVGNANEIERQSIFIGSCGVALH
jgi:hypothetical protein